MIRPLTALATVAAFGIACDLSDPTPTLEVRVAVAPNAIVAGGRDTATILVTIVNLSAARVERVCLATTCSRSMLGLDRRS
jgi:hypothetical protein